MSPESLSRSLLGNEVGFDRDVIVFAEVSVVPHVSIVLPSHHCVEKRYGGRLEHVRCAPVSLAGDVGTLLTANT
jgi:hypothetical protein